MHGPRWPPLQVTKWPAMKRWSRRYLQKAFKGKQVCAAGRPAPGSACGAQGHAHSLLPHPAAPHMTPAPTRVACCHHRPFVAAICPLCALCQVIVGDQPISFDAYCRYSDQNCDELPLYL